MKQQFLRFLLSGGSNTAFTYLLYLAILTVLSYKVAYTVAYCVGIVSSYWLNIRFVFPQPWSWKKLFAYPSVYLFQYLASIVILTVLVEWLSIDKRIAPLIAIGFTVPMVFLMTRWLLVGENHRSTT